MTPVTLTKQETAKLKELIAAYKPKKGSRAPAIHIKDGQFSGPHRPYISVGRKQKDLKDVPPKMDADSTRSIEVFFIGKGRHEELLQQGFVPCPVPGRKQPHGVGEDSTKTEDNVEGDK